MSEPEAGLSPAGRGGWGRRTERETADGVEMMTWVRAAGPNSAEADYLRDALKSDACGELMKLHRANLLLTRVKALLYKTVPTPVTLPAPPDDWRESAEGLIYVSVEQSLGPFFDGAVFGDGECRWRSDGGTSVQKFFVNKCLFTFKDLYLKEHEKRGSIEIPYPNIVEDDATARLFLHPIKPEDPETRAVYTDLIRRIGQEMTEQEARIVLEKSFGRTHEEIGRDLSMTVDAVNGRLRRLRRRIGC